MNRFAGLTLLTCAVLLPWSASADQVFSGVVNFRGQVQNLARPGSISFVATGLLRNANSGDVVNTSMGGLFRSSGRVVINTNHSGPFTLYVNDRGVLEKSVRTVNVYVTRTMVYFPGGSVRLDRPINGALNTRQNISGRGLFRTRS